MRLSFVSCVLVVVACGPAAAPAPENRTVNYTPTPPPAPFEPDATPEPVAIAAATGPTGSTAAVVSSPPPTLPVFSIASIVGQWRQPAVEMGSRETYSFAADGSYHRLTQSLDENGAIDFETHEDGVFSLRDGDRVVITDEPASALRAYVSSYISAQYFVPEAALPTTALDGIKGSFHSYKRMEAYAGALSDDVTEVTYTFGDNGIMHAVVVSTAEGTVRFDGVYGPLDATSWAFTAKDAQNRKLESFIYLIDGVALSVGTPAFVKVP